MAVQESTISRGGYPWALAVGAALGTALLYITLPRLAPSAIPSELSPLLLGIVNGIVVGMAVRLDRRAMPAVAIGAGVGIAAGELIAGHFTGFSLVTAVVVAAQLAGMLLLLHRNEAWRFRGTRDLVVFAGVILAISSVGGLVSAFAAANSVDVPIDDGFLAWGSWVIDDLFGLMCIAPAFFTFHRPSRWVWTRTLEWIVAVAYTALSVWYVFVYTIAGSQGLFGWPYFITFGSIWIAVRLGTQAVAPVVAASFWVAVVATAEGVGAFADASPEPLGRLLAVEMFCIVMAAVLFSLAVLRDEGARSLAEIQRSQRLLLELINGTDSVIYAKAYESDGHRPGATLLINAAGERFVGRSADEVLGLANEDLFPPEVAAAFTEEDLQVVRTGMPVKAQRRVTLPGGGTAVFEGTSLPLTDPSGRVWGVAGVSTDVTALVLAREHQETQAELLHAVFELSPTPAVRLTVASGSGVRVRAANTAMCRLLGVTSGQVEDCDLMEHVNPEDAGTALDLLAYAESNPALTDGTAVRQRELRMIAEDGRTLWVLMSAAALSGRAGEVEIVAQFEDFTARRAAEQALNEQAMRDPVTGLPNRRALHERMDAALQRLRRHPGVVTVLFCDLDNFKDVNDSLGHQVGDRLLVAAAARLRAALRPEDTFARLGGDEFVALGEGISDVSDAVALATRLQDQLSSPWVYGEQVFRPAMSVGIAMTTDPDVSVDEILRRSDLAMYRAKESGRDRIEVYDRTVDEEVQLAVAVQQELRRAIDTDHLALEYQPIVDMGSHELVGMEALVRMCLPDGTVVPPTDFVPQAEASGLVIPMGAWVVERAIADLSVLHRSSHDATLSINVSPTQLRDERFADFLLERLSSSGIPATCLCVEVTETALIHDPARSNRELSQLSSAGVSIALDDFGTGYSSLSWLTQFPVDIVKIDRSFTEDVGIDPRKTAIISAVISVSHELGFRVVAEGVETAEQARRLLDLGCDRGQGFLFGRPSPVGGPPWA